MKILNKRFDWIDKPSSFKIEEDKIEIVSDSNTDYFVDPQNGTNPMKIPILWTSPNEIFQFSTKINAELKSDYDAGTLIIYQNKKCWAKLCLEISPINEIIVVSVVTNNQKSDDCVHQEIKEKNIYLRISGLGNGDFVFHSSEDSKFWRFLRYFKLTGKDFKIGFSSQCPHGQNHKSIFTEFKYGKDLLENMRNGQ